DPAPPARDHAGRDRPGEVEERVEVVVDHLAPAGRRLLEQLDLVERPRAVDQRVDASPGRLHAADERLGDAAVPALRPPRERATTGRLEGLGRLRPRPLAGPVAEGDGPARPGQIQADPPADAPGPTGDQRNPINPLSHAVSDPRSPILTIHRLHPT